MQEGENLLETVYKILLNSLYGKTIHKPINTIDMCFRV